MQSTGNTILITGGTSGIGRALAEKFHALGNKVIIAGRRKALLDEITSRFPGMAAYTLDMDDGAAIAGFARQITAEYPELNVVINNAGIMIAEDLKGGDFLPIAEAIVTTNVLGPIRLTSALLPHLRTRPHATIVTVSSGLAFVPLAATPTYSATKAAIHSYSLSLRHQLRDTNIKVVELIPPGVQTDLMPGHAVNPHMMPLDEFIAETMGLFQQQPTPQEISVQRVLPLRRAETEGRFAQTFQMLNTPA
jgi:uncharacterized oxidoreductase